MSALSEIILRVWAGEDNFIGKLCWAFNIVSLPGPTGAGGGLTESQLSIVLHLICLEGSEWEGENGG